MFDARQQTHLETANVPSQDQLQTRIDVSVQYRIDGSMAPDIREQTCDAATVVRVHLIPALRSLLREQAVEREGQSWSAFEPNSSSRWPGQKQAARRLTRKRLGREFLQTREPTKSRKSIMRLPEIRRIFNCSRWKL